jgi:hypothetical protein
MFNGSIEKAKELWDIYHEKVLFMADSNLFSYSEIYNKIPQYMLNEWYVSTTLRHIEAEPNDLAYFAKSDKNTTESGWEAFIRPNTADKIFAGQVINNHNIRKNWKIINFYEPDPHAVVIMAPWKYIDAEWRLVVIRGKVIAASQYLAPTTRFITKKGALKKSKLLVTESLKLW